MPATADFLKSSASAGTLDHEAAGVGVTFAFVQNITFIKGHAASTEKRIR
jgi:hypothetical protein